MSVFFYHIFLFLFKAAALTGSLFNNKSKKWLQGRKGLFEKLKAAIPADGSIIWMHCSSLGEFEQGRPVLEKLRSNYPGYKVLLTFFSPSGYEVQKNYAGADWVFYLPMDGRSNAKRFLEIVHPSLVIFVKYDLWYFYLKEINKKNTPLLLISALISKNTILKWYGRMHRKMFAFISHFFVQDETSKRLLDEKGFTNSTVAGDTRFDRVIEIAEKFQPILAIEKFIGDTKVLVAGSTWPEDELMISKALALLDDITLTFIIAPHEISVKRIDSVKKILPAVTLSEIQSAPAMSEKVQAYWAQITTPDKHATLIIDNFGMLSSLYKYGDIALVGGGMTPYGVHNVLEAAVYNKPVIIGPYYKKYLEAVGLVNDGGAIVIKNEEELATTIKQLLNDTDGCYAKAALASGNFVQQRTGAAKKILQFIQENRLLTN